MTTAKKAIIQAMVEGVLVDLLVQTNAENVMVDETTTLTAKLAEMMADIAALPTNAMITASIAALRTELMGDGVEVIQATINGLGALASKSTVEESDLSPELKEKLNAASHENQAVLDGITAEKVTAWDAKSTVYVGTSAPANMADHDLFFKIVE